jgi:spore coat protein U-like protein
MGYNIQATGTGKAQPVTYSAALAPQPGVTLGTHADQLIATVAF